MTAEHAEPLWPIPEPALNPQQHHVHRPKRRGRQVLMSPEAEQSFFMLLRMGHSRGPAATACGISPETVSAWMRRGHVLGPRRPPRPEDVAFADAVDRAEAEAEMMVSANLVRQSRTSTPAAIAWLQAHHPERWPRSRKTTQDHDRRVEPTPPSTSQTQPDDRIWLTPKEVNAVVSRLLAERRAALAPAREPGSGA